MRPTTTRSLAPRTERVVAPTAAVAPRKVRRFMKVDLEGCVPGFAVRAFEHGGGLAVAQEATVGEHAEGGAARGMRRVHALGPPLLTMKPDVMPVYIVVAYAWRRVGVPNEPDARFAPGVIIIRVVMQSGN